MKKHALALTLLLTFLLSGCGKTSDIFPSPQESPSSLPSATSPGPSPTAQLTLPPEEMPTLPPPIPGEEHIVWEDKFFALCVLSGLYEQQLSNEDVQNIKIYPSQIAEVSSIEIFHYHENFSVSVDRGREVVAADASDAPDYKRKVQTLGDLHHFSNLKHFELADSEIVSLEPLADRTMLETLIIGPSHVEEISLLAHLTNLKTLWLSYSPITDLSPIYGLDQLENLNVSGLMLDNINFVKNYPNLLRLLIEDCGVSDLSPLSELTELIMLRANNNNISDLSPLSGLRYLDYLSLCGNPIKSLKPLEDLKALRTLWLDKEQEHSLDISPLVSPAIVYWKD